MGIIVHENSQTFHLCNDHISYIIKILPSGQAGQLYYGSRIGIFRYCGHEIQNGKPPLEGLPAVYVETEDEAQTLKLRFIDEVTRMELVLSYTIFEALPVVTRSVRFKNCGSEKLKLNRAMSLCLDLPDAVYDMTDLTGAWARERQCKNTPDPSGRTEHPQYARSQQSSV